MTTKKNSRREIQMPSLTRKRFVCNGAGVSSVRLLQCARIKTRSTALIRKKKITHSAPKMTPEQ